MTHATSTSARTLLLAAGTAGFVALGSGVAGAESLSSSVQETVGPVAKYALVEGAAPAMNSLAPEGVAPIADGALSELQQTAHDPAKPAPDLAAPLPEGEALRTPLGELPNPTPALAGTVSELQDATGLDGDPHDTVGHDIGRSLEEGGQRAGASVEDMGERAGTRVEDTAMEVLPHTVESVYHLRQELEPPRIGQLAPLPDPSALTSVVGGDALDLTAPVTVPQSASATRPINVEGPLADPRLPRLSGTGLPLVDDTAAAIRPQLAEAGLPLVAEGIDTQTAEDLVSELGRGTDLLNDLDTSDVLSISGGTAPQETPGGMTQHPTFMDLPGSEALPLVS